MVAVRSSELRLICGSFWGKRGPVDGIAADPMYLDISIAPGKRKVLPVETTRHAFPTQEFRRGLFGEPDSVVTYH